MCLLFIKKILFLGFWSIQPKIIIFGVLERLMSSIHPKIIIFGLMEPNKFFCLSLINLF